MVAHVKFLRHDLGAARRGPDPSVQAISHRAAVQDVGQMFPLGGAQLGGPPAAIALQQPVGPRPIPSADPGMHPRAIDLEPLGDPPRRRALDTEPDGLQA